MYPVNPWQSPYNQPQYISQPIDSMSPIIQYCNFITQQCRILNGELRYAYQIINNISHSKKEFTSRKIEYDSYSNEWYCTERNDRKVKIGNLSMSSCYIINIKPDERFDALYCVLKDDTGPHQVIIPYKNFIHRKILEFLPFFKRNPDCPDKYITAVFFAILHDFINNRKDDIKFISFEKQSGWYEIVNEKMRLLLILLKEIITTHILTNIVPKLLRNEK